MSKVPSLNYDVIVAALGRAGWTGLRQRGSHIRLQKVFGEELVRITIPAHKPLKRSTLSHILKQARLDVDQFLRLL